MNETIVASALIGVGVTLLFVRLLAIERRLARLSRVDAKLDALLRNAGVTFDEYQDVPPDVREALQQGRTVLAVKLIRQTTGVGLKEAKELVDEVRRRQVRV